MSLAGSAHKAVLVKETGMPHGGDDDFSPAAQRAFWASYVSAGRLARTQDSYRVWISYAAAFEAFDLHWKAEQSKMAIEERWGLLAADRKPFPAFFVWQEAQSSPLETK